MPLYLSRIRLSRGPLKNVLGSLLRGEDAGQRRSAQHNLLWLAFSESPDQTRDFLWRAESDGSFLTLSPRRPREVKELFEKPEVKNFEPALREKDRLAFQLQVNATKMKKESRKRVDVVMDELYGLSRDERIEQRMDLAQKAGRAWLACQGEKAGFSLMDARVEDYRQEALPRFDVNRRDRPQLGILDMSGELEVTDPAAFLAQLAKGFGRAKAFGCGLMLIRRAG